MNDRHQLIIGLVLIGLTLAVGVWQWNELQGIKEQTTALQSEASNLNAISEELANTYKSIKVEVTETRNESAQALSQVFPDNEDLTSLTRLFDDYEAKNNFSTNPFFISTIQYNSSLNSSEDFSTYRSLDFTLTATASKKNLLKFLEMIENSGSLEASNRLMSVSNLTVSYPDQYGGTYDIKTDIQAYYAPEL